MNIIILGVRIIEDSDNRGSDNRGCTVIHPLTTKFNHHASFTLSDILPLIDIFGILHVLHGKRRRD